MWFAGIDWADRHHDIVVINEVGSKVGSLRVEHTPEGLAKLVAFLRDLAPLEQIACIIETKHGRLWLVPRRFPLKVATMPPSINALRVSSPCATPCTSLRGPSTQQEAWAKDYYDRKRREGKSHSMAIRALANVWVRIIFAMWHKKEAYQRTIFEAAQRLHMRRAA